MTASSSGHAHHEIPTIDQTAVHAERLLGTGSFAVVYAVRLDEPCRHNVLQHHSAFVAHSSQATTSQHHHHHDLWTFWKSTSEAPTVNSSIRSHSSVSSSTSVSPIASSTTTTTFALKRLKGPVVLDAEERQQASDDLIREATLLRDLPAHPHIIALFGVSPQFWNNDTNATTSAQRFLVVQHLEGGTLDDRLHEWMEDRSRRMSPQKSNKAVAQLERVRQSGLVDIAAALQFLHSHRIIYRDLKPQNIGYDGEGQVRLFDFGFARYLPPKDEGRKLMTGCVGTLRYMAPEVAAEEYYNASADIYAWGSLVWEVCLLQYPYGRRAQNPVQLQQWVIQGKNRPQPRLVAAPLLKPLVAACLQRSMDQRPTWETIRRTLRQQKL